jgi:hypothetical protein
MKEASRSGSRNEASLSKGTAWQGHGGRAPLLGTPKGMLSEALDWTSVYIGAPLLGNMDTLVLGPLG